MKTYSHPFENVSSYVMSNKLITHFIDVANMAQYLKW